MTTNEPASGKPLPRRKVAQGFVREVVDAWMNHRGRRLSAALAYYSAFSAASGFVIVIALAGVTLGKGAIQEEIAARVAEALGQRAADLMRTIIAGIATPSSSLTAAAISVVTLFYGALRVFVQLQDALNSIWDVPPGRARSVIDRIRDHAYAFLVVLAGGFLVLASLAANAVAATLSRFFGFRLSDFPMLWHLGDLLVSFGLLTFVFVLLYRNLPSVKIAWTDVIYGAILSTLLFFVARVLLGVYLTYGALGSIYGAAGSFLVLLAWFYYSAQILLLGAEVSHVYAIRFGSHAKLAAVLVSETQE